MTLNCEYDELNLDEACVTVNNEVNNPNLWLYTLSSDCALCPYTRIAEITPVRALNITINTAREQLWRIIETDGSEKYISAAQEEGVYCQLKPNVEQYGIYELVVDQNSTCNLVNYREPINQYVTLAIAFGSIILLLVGLSILKRIRRSIHEANITAQSAPVKQRIRSLDTVRGICIVLMIFVNGGAGSYVILGHVTWDGLYIGDLVFPCFLWIMGVCIPLSVSSQLSRGTTRRQLLWAIVKRSFYLFFIGLSLNTLNGNMQLERIRIFGVLQRFSVCYFVTASVYTLALRIDKQPFKDSVIRDVLILMPQWVVAFIVLAIYCAIAFSLPVPGCSKGYFGPGGRHENGKYLNCTGGATGYVDKIILGVDHIYQHTTADGVYGSGPFDPEGVLGSLTSIFQVFLGIQAGQTLRDFTRWKERFIRWLSWALILGLFGVALHIFGNVPINKNLWSISFVMVTTCFSLGLLMVCYLLVDVVTVWEGGPFRIPGMNALVMYVGHQVCYQMFPFHWKIAKMNTHGWLLAECLWCVALWTCIAYVLHRKKIYVTL
ncbi:heparan-alpha-glucosaminide N-acetyltransferase-like [Phymastichus coffea]|uniref:heparan-alpha-glucosaminide N-acetyltransferase-like n=1 Tax=Phymastichus coffea TaxID=108790 RepID=UPI00273C4E89|nr:heparan-alpha-glucosaminide N-acetyltransferase-like [Phymastichus coffea]